MCRVARRKRAGLSSRAVRVGNGAEPAGLDSRSAQAPLSDIPGSGHGGPGSLVTSPSESEDDSDLINGACFNVDLAPQNRRDGEYRQRPMPRKEGDPRGTWSPSVSEPANGIASRWCRNHCARTLGCTYYVVSLLYHPLRYDTTLFG